MFNFLFKHNLPTKHAHAAAKAQHTRRLRWQINRLAAGLFQNFFNPQTGNHKGTHSAIRAVGLQNELAPHIRLRPRHRGLIAIVGYLDVDRLDTRLCSGLRR